MLRDDAAIIKWQNGRKLEDMDRRVTETERRERKKDRKCVFDLTIYYVLIYYCSQFYDPSLSLSVGFIQTEIQSQTWYAIQALFHWSKSKMRTINNSVDTINAAATAIVSAESRVQPNSVQVHTQARHSRFLCRCDFLVLFFFCFVLNIHFLFNILLP